MTTYKITNIVPRIDTNDMVVFYELSSGHGFSNIVPISTTIAQMKSWGQEKCNWFDERVLMIEELQQQLTEQPIVEVVEEIIEQ